MYAVMCSGLKNRRSDWLSRFLITYAIWLVCSRFVRYGRPKGNKPTQVLFRARFLLVPGKTKFGIM